MCYIVAWYFSFTAADDCPISHYLPILHHAVAVLIVQAKFGTPAVYYVVKILLVMKKRVVLSWYLIVLPCSLKVLHHHVLRQFQVLYKKWMSAGFRSVLSGEWWGLQFIYRNLPRSPPPPWLILAFKIWYSIGRFMVTCAYRAEVRKCRIKSMSR